ncbi:BOMB/KIRA PROTEINS [Salix koriyanagi]|uniref:BOMB/KIRA PROTEINS n=1 Tax=Salix koriyanagi TaxID=2511006 RepID=A0A9Q0WBJ6_9ROSI|nr:BOMB/KIRA PROTEINS [Salix koriyanagi]
MCYLNRKTLKKSWSWPKNQKLDLELNMSTIPNCPDQWNNSRSSPEESNNKNHASRNNNMVALACSNCHLLVILSFLPQLQVSPLFPSPPIATEKSLPRQVPEHSTPPELMASA